MDLLSLMECLHREVWVQRAPFTTRSQDGVEVLIDTFSGIMGVPILIREEYRSIWQAILSQRDDIEASPYVNNGGMVVTGQPGIGKSAFSH